MLRIVEANLIILITMMCWHRSVLLRRRRQILHRNLSWPPVLTAVAAANRRHTRCQHQCMACCVDLINQMDLIYI